MKVTVILCTYNRCQSLAKALESVAGSTMPSSVAWEVLVVDNNSHDGTREVVEDFSRRDPNRFRYLFERIPGKSHALNAGIREARGDVLAFIDDDVTVGRDWLQNLTTVLESNKWVGVGGRILPANSFPAPPWLPLDGQYNMAGILALFDLGNKAAELDRPPFGTNMAFRKKLFEKYGGFRLDLGPIPGSELRNEDTEFGRRLLAAGEHLLYVPSAVVYHVVPENRLKKEYFLRFCFDHGRAIVREVGKRPDIWGIPRHYLTVSKMGTLLVGRALKWMWTCCSPKLRFYRKGRTWMTAGELLEAWRQSRNGNWRENNAVQEAKGGSSPRT